MISQKLISYKIDCDLLVDLDREVSLGWRKRNALINEAVSMYLHVADARRRIRSYGNVEDKRRALNLLMRRLVPEVEQLEIMEKYILSAASTESKYDEAATEACNTDCPCYAQGTCPYGWKEKMHCHRFRAFYNGEDD